MQEVQRTEGEPGEEDPGGVGGQGHGGRPEGHLLRGGRPGDEYSPAALNKSSGEIIINL